MSRCICYIFVVCSPQVIIAAGGNPARKAHSWLLFVYFLAVAIHMLPAVWRSQNKFNILIQIRIAHSWRHHQVVVQSRSYLVQLQNTRTRGRQGRYIDGTTVAPQMKIFWLDIRHESHAKKHSNKDDDDADARVCTCVCADARSVCCLPPQSLPLPLPLPGNQIKIYYDVPDRLFIVNWAALVATATAAQTFLAKSDQRVSALNDSRLRRV